MTENYHEIMPSTAPTFALLIWGDLEVLPVDMQRATNPAFMTGGHHVPPLTTRGEGNL
jgi:hypothetical protein